MESQGNWFQDLGGEVSFSKTIMLPGRSRDRQKDMKRGIIEKIKRMLLDSNNTD